MDVHPDAKPPSGARSPLPVRGDLAQLDRDATAAQLRARLLKLIIKQEQSRGRSSADATKPR
jgi:hypothetical protein